MTTFDLLPDNPDSPLRLVKLESGFMNGSAVRDEEASEGDLVVFLTDEMTEQYVHLGAVDEFIQVLQDADLDPSREEHRVLRNTDRIEHVPPNADYGGEEEDIDPESVFLDRDCVICSELVEYSGNGLAVDWFGHHQFLHVDCLDEFCEALERVWDAPEQLLADII